MEMALSRISSNIQEHKIYEDVEQRNGSKFILTDVYVTVLNFVLLIQE